MNEFTKEELQTIKKSLDGLMFSKFYSEDTQVVYKKVQSLIDDYVECTHKLSRKTLQIDFCEECHSFKFVYEGESDE